ncbi:MAG: Na+/H+ antiporter subunit G [Phaeovulum sp.]|uniref:Na+/H+ antiporter subunit G n=1 Tax=Phaeovulum sp. TaxID=2934796 RepID=UPI002732B487|nr:Na+/H+ antiporter subunit G [Phaeovulum sp.]MDP3860773.1 Na+/H+ antiporter subunit G [Phaeovulum sp.]
MVWDLLITGFLVLAGVFGLVGSIGLVKLPDPMTRLHAPTKATTLGVGGVLIASMLFFAAKMGHFSAHELLITLFLFLTAPVSALFLAKANLHHDRPQNLPHPEGSEWAILRIGTDTAAETLAGPVPEQPLTPREGRET